MRGPDRRGNGGPDRLTVYDMCKAIDKRMTLGEIHLVEKHGGKSGDFYFEEQEH